MTLFSVAQRKGRLGSCKFFAKVSRKRTIQRGLTEGIVAYRSLVRSFARSSGSRCVGRRQVDSRLRLGHLGHGRRVRQAQLGARYAIERSALPLGLGSWAGRMWTDDDEASQTRARSTTRSLA